MTRLSQLYLLVSLAVLGVITIVSPNTAEPLVTATLLATRDQMAIWNRTMRHLNTLLIHTSSPSQVMRAISKVSSTIQRDYPYPLFEYHQTDISSLFARAFRKLHWELGRPQLLCFMNIVRQQSAALHINISLIVRNLYFTHYYGFQKLFRGHDVDVDVLLTAMEDPKPSLATTVVICHGIARHHNWENDLIFTHRCVLQDHSPKTNCSNSTTTPHTRSVTDSLLHSPERMLQDITSQTISDVLRNLGRHKSHDASVQASLPAKLVFLVNVVIPRYRLQVSLESYHTIRSYCVQHLWLYMRHVLYAQLSPDHTSVIQILHRLNSVMTIRNGWAYRSFELRFPKLQRPDDPTREIFYATSEQWKKIMITWRRVLWNNLWNEPHTQTELVKLVQNITKQNVKFDPDNSHLTMDFWQLFFQRFYSLRSEYGVEFIQQLLTMMEGKGSRIVPNMFTFDCICVAISMNQNMNATDRVVFANWIYEFVVTRFELQLAHVADSEDQFDLVHYN